MTVLNIRMSVGEKEELKERAAEFGDSISSYARKILFQDDNTSDYVDNTNVLQEKDERISDLKTQIDDYKKQIEQLHTIILATQKDNQLLIEQKTKRWWKFWEWEFISGLTTLLETHSLLKEFTNDDPILHYYFFFLYLALGFALIKNRSKLNLSKPLAITSLVIYIMILCLISYITLFFGCLVIILNKLQKNDNGCFSIRVISVVIFV